MNLDTVGGNVRSLDDVLAEVEAMTGLKAFIRFELLLPHGPVRVALVQCGAVSLEFFEHAAGVRPAGLAYISRVVLEVPHVASVERELEPDLVLAVRSGPRRRMVEVELCSGRLQEDLGALMTCCGATPGDGADVVRLGDVTLRFHPLDVCGDVPDPGQVDPGLRLPGWHRLMLSGEPVLQATPRLAQRLEVLLPPFLVMPGLREAMFVMPSGLVLQITEQQLWKMMPVFLAHKLIGALRGRPVRMKDRPL